MLAELVPSDLIKQQSVNDWKKKISLEYLKDGDMTIEQAKVAFLKYVYQWPTFGSAFFEVQVSEHLHVCSRFVEGLESINLKLFAKEIEIYLRSQ